MINISQGNNVDSRNKLILELEKPCCSLPLVLSDWISSLKEFFPRNLKEEILLNLTENFS